MDEKINVVSTNRAARHEFFIDETFEAGLMLVGTEVKSLRTGRGASIGDGYVYIDGTEAWLENAHIPEYSQGNWTNHEPRRRRKLLLHHLEIDELGIKTRERGYTIVPMRLYFKAGKAKIEIGLGRGKKLHDKRQALREKQDSREAQRDLKAAHRR